MQKIIADRYELLEIIGQGGMADVYLARDAILNRTIAVKILRTGLAKDPVYVTRFQREASAAAALSHKNIVDIYDVGEENNQYYIVMEYVPGRTLKELINKRGALHVVEAIDIMKQVVSGTAKAHQLGIVHRDLKPQNILVTDSGTAKIADFGIASMQSLAQVTQTDVIMGSLHYLAPELARGEKASSQSDIYALGIVLYELLRGEVPFNGESPVNIALKHMQEDLPSIRSFNPSIPQAVENIIIRATAKNLKDRYLTAQEMLTDIEGCMEREEEKVVFAYTSDELPTIVLDSKEVFNTQEQQRNPVETLPQEEIEKEEIKRSKGTNNSKKSKSDKNKSLAIKIGLGVLGAVIIGAIIYFLFFAGSGQKPQTMPDLKGMKREDAVQMLSDYDVVINENDEEELTDDVEAGLVARTNPASGKTIKSGDTITFVISTGKYIVIEDYVGKNVTEAQEALEALGYVVTINPEESDEPEGTVLRQSVRKDTKVDPNADDKEITLMVSEGEYIVLDNYIGMPIDRAEKRLTDLGMTVEKVPNASSEAAGTVLGQSKSSGTRIGPNDDRSIILTYSEEKPEEVQIPSVLGSLQNIATQAIKNAGFEVEAVEGEAATHVADEGKVYRVTPSQGTMAEKGTKVTVYYYGKYVPSGSDNSDDTENENDTNTSNVSTNTGNRTDVSARTTN